jgi:predicted DNA repair protein MutK
MFQNGIRFMIYAKAMSKSEQNEKLDKIMPTAIKVLSVIIVFGMPLVPGAVVMAGYGAYKAYKKVISKRGSL